MSISTILSIVSMKSPSTNLNENDSILASREFIHRLLSAIAAKRQPSVSDLLLLLRLVEFDTASAQR